MFVVRTQISQNQDYPEKAQPGLTQNKPNYLYQNKLGYINDQFHIKRHKTTYFNFFQLVR